MNKADKETYDFLRAFTGGTHEEVTAAMEHERQRLARAKAAERHNLKTVTSGYE